jgi:hypothetical protein
MDSCAAGFLVLAPFLRNSACRWLYVEFIVRPKPFNFFYDLFLHSCGLRNQVIEFLCTLCKPLDSFGNVISHENTGSARRLRVSDGE